MTQIKPFLLGLTIGAISMVALNSLGWTITVNVWPTYTMKLEDK